MSKRDDLMRAGAANALESMGARNGDLPPGLDPTAAMKKPAHLEGLSREKAAARIALDRIAPDPNQPREEFDPESLERLAESLRTRGQLQPIRVRWDAVLGKYVILVGERRWRAARMVGLAELSCIVHDGDLSPEDRLATQLIENALREDLRPIEQARAYQTLMGAKSWSARQLAGELAINPATVTRALALLELPETVQEAVEQGTLPAHTAYEVSKLPDQETQVQVASVAVEQKLSRQEVAELAQSVRARRPTPAPKPQPVELNLGDGTVVVVRWKKTNSTSTTQALRKALRMVQEQERDGQAA